MNSTTLLRNNPLPMLQIAGIHLPRETRRPSEVAAENLQAQSRFYVSPFDLSDVVEAEWADTKLQGSFKLSTDSYRWKSAEVEPLLSFFESYSTITIRRSEEATTARLTGMCSPTQLSTAPQFPRVSYQPTSAKYQRSCDTRSRIQVSEDGGG